MTHPASRARERCTALGLRRKLRNAPHRPAITRPNYRCSSGRLCCRHRRGRCRRPSSECVADHLPSRVDRQLLRLTRRSGRSPTWRCARCTPSIGAGRLSQHRSGAAEVPVDELRGPPDCCGDHGAFTSRRRAGSGCCCRISTSSMLWGSAVRRRPRCTPTIRSWRSAKPLA